MPDINELNCLKGATTISEIKEKFDADGECMKCNNIIYKDGVITCKYGEMEENTNETN